MGVRFTTAEAYEADDCGEPIMMTRSAVERLFRKHDLSGAECVDFWLANPGVNNEFNAAKVLAWLGY